MGGCVGVDVCAFGCLFGREGATAACVVRFRATVFRRSSIFDLPQAKYHKKKQKFYYYNKATNQTAWRKPASFVLQCDDNTLRRAIQIQVVDSSYSFASKMKYKASRSVIHPNTATDSRSSCSTGPPPAARSCARLC